MRNELAPSEDKAAGKKWYVLYLSPRSEKIAAKYLESSDYEVFLPLLRETRVWRNRQKREIEIPLFPNYLFVHTFEHELYTIRSFSRIVRAVTHGGRPVFLTEKEVEGVRQLLQYGRELKVEPRFSAGQQVRISTGPLAGYEGILVRRQGKTRFGLQLRAINYTVWVDSDTSELEKL